MTDSAEDSGFPTLFAHTVRKDWGVGVLSGERDGKRRYLFEGGEERTMGGGAYDLMRRVETLDRDQQATYARLTALLARRQGHGDAKAGVFSLLEQLGRLRQDYPGGLLDPAWLTDKRAQHAGRARESALAEAQELLSRKTLDALIKAQQFDGVWNNVITVLSKSEMVPADQLRSLPNGEELRNLSTTVRELLYGAAVIEQRFDRFVAAFETAFRQPPRWETATALSAVVSPTDQVYVELVSFRKQIKALGWKGSITTRPSGAGYTRCVTAARLIANKLAEHGEVPRDLLDVHDFIRLTLKPVVGPRRIKAKPKAKAKAEEAEVDEDADS
jgi:hypothetical protein